MGGDGRPGPFSVLFVCCGCVNWTLVQSKTHRTMTARCAPPCTRCMFFDACAVKKHDRAVLNSPSDAQLSKIVLKQKVRKSTKNVAKTRPRNSTLDHNRFHKIVGEVHLQLSLREPQCNRVTEECTHEQSRPRRDRLQNTVSTTQPGQHGRFEAAHFSCRTSTQTTSWQRQSLFCSHQDYTQMCRLTPTSPFAWGFSATCCSSCKTQTLTSSTLPSQVFTQACSNRYYYLASSAANKPKREKTCF